MHSRRRVLMGFIPATTVAATGCLDAFEDSEEDESGQNMEDVGGGNNGEVVGEDTEAEDTSEQTPDDSNERRELLETYNDGIVASNEGMRARENGVGAWNDENHNLAESHFSNGEDHFTDSRNHFRDAVELTYRIEDPEAREICDTAAEYAAIKRQAMRTSQQMASAGADGDTDRANSYLEDVRDLEQEASRMNVRETSTLQTVVEN